MANEVDYKKLLDSGCSIEYMDISLCDLKNYVPWYKRQNKSVYQVHSNKFTEVYHNIDAAVKKFIELKEAKNK